MYARCFGVNTMRKVILVEASESARVLGQLRKLRNDLLGHVEIVQPGTTASANGHTVEWLTTKAAKAAFVVIFYAAAPVQADEPTKPSDALPPNTEGTTLSLTSKERALLPDNPTILVAISRAEDRCRLPADLVHFRCFDLSSFDGYEALLCGLVHEPVNPRSRVKEDAISAAFKVVMGVVATLVGGLDKTKEFLAANLNENFAWVLPYCMTAIVLVLLFAGLMVLFRLIVNLLQSMQYFDSVESLSGKTGLQRYMIIGVTAVVVIAFGVHFFPRLLRADEIANKHQREWAQRLGRSQLPNGGIREHPDRGIAQVWSTSQSLAGLFSSQFAAMPVTADIQRAFTFIERARITNLTERCTQNLSFYG
jgi:hypothetical protein